MLPEIVTQWYTVEGEIGTVACSVSCQCVRWRLTTRVRRKRSVYVRISELLFVPRIEEVVRDQSIAPTLPLSYTTQFLPAEGTALSVFIARMKRP